MDVHDKGVWPLGDGGIDMNDKGRVLGPVKSQATKSSPSVVSGQNLQGHQTSGERANVFVHTCIHIYLDTCEHAL